MDGRDIWRRNFIVLLGWMLFYQVTQILILDFIPVSVTRQSRCPSSDLHYEATRRQLIFPFVR